MLPFYSWARSLLRIRYPNTPWVFPVDTLSMSDPHLLPQISVWGLHLNSTYLLIFVDLDYQPDMVIHGHHDLQLEPGSHGNGPYDKRRAEYIAPQPPLGSHHRYVYLAFEQHHEYTFPIYFRYTFPKTMEARAGFDLQQFVEVNGLQHQVAGNDSFVNNDEPVTGTLTSTMPIPSPMITWVRSAPCSQPVIPTATTPADAPEHGPSFIMNQTMESEVSPDKLPKSVKVRSTCNACQQAKIRCSHERPSCKRCQKHKIDCVYSISRRLGRPAKKREPHLDSTAGHGGSDGPLNKRLRGPKKKKVKEEPLPDFGSNEQSTDNENKPLFETLTFDHGHLIDDILVEDASLQTPKLMDIIAAAPFSMSDDLDVVSDSWLHEFLPNPFTDSTQGCEFFDPLQNDVKLDDATTRASIDHDRVPSQSESVSDSTPEALDLSSSSGYHAANNGCLSHSESVSDSTQGYPQGNSIYPGHFKQDAFSWSQPPPFLGGEFGPEPSSFFPQVNTSKRAHDYSFSEENLTANLNSLSSICSCRNHEQAVRDLIRVNACALQTGPTVAIDSILTYQRVLQQLTETILQCRSCPEIMVSFLMFAMISIDSLLTPLDKITSAENDVVERLFPGCFGPLTQDYRADSGLTAHNRRFRGGSEHLRAQLDACPLIIGDFCVPSEEKFVFVKKVLHRRLTGLQRTVHRIEAYTQGCLVLSTGKVMIIKETYQRLQLIVARLIPAPTMPTSPILNATKLGDTCSSTKLSDEIIYQIFRASMESESGCQCSLDAFQIMDELRNVPQMMELATILAMAERIHSQGQAMLKCKGCRANPGSILMTLPVLTDQCVALFETACRAYNVTRNGALLDPRLPQLLCIPSRVQLGRMQLDDDEIGVLVRLLLGKSSIKLLELLKELRSVSKECMQSHRSRVTTLRSCEPSIEPAIRRIVVFMEQIEEDATWPGTLKETASLTPADHFANQGLFLLTLSGRST
ncbi:hypothetical protein BJX76DRAFT_366074 [Aspergillus varians]